MPPPKFEVPRASIDIPRISTPRVEVPRFTLRIPRVTRTREDIENAIKAMVDWGALNYLRDGLAYILSFPLKWLYDLIIGDQINRVEESVENSVNAALSEARDKVQSSFNRLTGDLNTKLNQHASKVEEEVNKALNQVGEKAEQAVNTAVEIVYGRLMGLSTNMSVTPAAIRNVSHIGFECYSPRIGARIHYVAVGR